VEAAFAELEPASVTAGILTNDMHACNTFENPEHVKEEIFTAYEITGKGLKFIIPACSIISFSVK